MDTACVEDLLAEGKAFTYETFSKKGKYGHPCALTPEYAAWKTRVEHVLLSLFGKSSAMYETFRRGDAVRLIGNAAEKFAQAQGLFLGSLQAALDTLKFDPSAGALEDPPSALSRKVFVVHGRDEKLKNQVEIFLGEIGLEPIVLHRKADEGMTVIEKFEKHSDVGYAFILLTPDDVAYPTSDDAKPDHDRKKENRARQNVLFEFGYFVAKLGRNRTCCIYKEGVTIPTDLSGLVYKQVGSSVEEAAFSILKDLKAVGYDVSI